MDPQEEIVSEIKQLQREADKHVFSLATGALALSITFRSSIAPEHAVALWVLKGAWISLLLSVLAYIANLIAKAWLWVDVLQTKNLQLNARRRVIVVLPRFLMMAGFTAGMSLLAAFALANLR